MVLLYSDADDPFKNGVEFDSEIQNIFKVTPSSNHELFNKLSKEISGYKNVKKHKYFEISAVYLFDSDKRAAFCEHSKINEKDHFTIFINKKILNLPEEKFLFVLHHEIGHAINYNNERNSHNVLMASKIYSLTTASIGAIYFAAWGAAKVYNSISGSDLALLQDNIILPHQNDLLKFSAISSILSATSMLASNLTYRYVEYFCDANGYKKSQVDSYPDIKDCLGSWHDNQNVDVADVKKSLKTKEVLEAIDKFFFGSTHPYMFERKAFIKVLNAKDKFVDKILNRQNNSEISK
jgi:Zn-dependent protease with chaperone function